MTFRLDFQTIFVYPWLERKEERPRERDKMGGKAVDGWRRWIIVREKRKKLLRENHHFSNFEVKIEGKL